MNEQYNEVFDMIKLKLVPKTQVDESQKEIVRLRSLLDIANYDLRKAKLEYEEQKLAVDIIRAEKESLEAEKKTFESKFNEVSLKLKQKTNQYDSFLMSQRKNSEQKNIQQMSTGTQTIKEEPQEIGIVNFPTSSSSRINETPTKTGSKRTNSSKNETPRTRAKRKKTEDFQFYIGRAHISNSKSRTTRKSTQKFSCETCLDNWGIQIQNDYEKNPDRNDAPDPKLKIPTFLSFMDYKDHKVNAHWLNLEDCCKEKSCHSYSGHEGLYGDWPHGNIKCKICSLSFKFQKHHGEHMQFEHANINSMSNKEIYDLFLQYNQS